MSQEPDIRRFSKQYIKDVQQLSKIVFGREISKEYYQTFFEDSNNCLGYLAYESGELVAFFPAIVLDMADGLTTYKVAQPVSIMIHPDHRHKNYFLLLYYKLIELAKNEGLVLFFGWPNSIELFAKLLRWKKVCVMQKLVIPVRTIPLAKLLFKFRIFYPLYKSLVKQVFSKYAVPYDDDIRKRLTPSVFPHLNRTKEFVLQKQRLGMQCIQLNQKVMFINLDYRLKIGDIEDCSLVEFSKILRRLKLYCALLGITEIVSYFNPEIPQYKKLGDGFQMKEDLTLMYKVLDINKMNTIPLVTFTDFDTF